MRPREGRPAIGTTASRPASRRPGPNFAPPRVAIASREGEFRALETPGAPRPNSRTSPYELPNAHRRPWGGGRRTPPETRRSRFANLEGIEQEAAAGLPPSDWDLESLRQRRDAANAAGDARIALATEEQVLRRHGQRPPLRPGSGNHHLGRTAHVELGAFRDPPCQFQTEIDQSRREILGSRMSDPRCPIRSSPVRAPDRSER